MNPSLQFSRAFEADFIPDNMNIEKEKSDFEILVEKHYSSLYRFALCLSQNEDRAVDLTRQTFHLWAGKGDRLCDSSKAKAWLFTTLYHKFLGPRRDEICFPIHKMNGGDVEPADITSDMISQMDSDTVARAIMEVGEHYRVPLMLYFENHSYQEIAEILNVRIGSTMALIARAKQQLYQILSRIFYKETQEKNIILPSKIWRKKI